MVTRYDKAIVATVGAVVAILNAAGVPVAEEVSQSVIAIATALAVLLVPNA
jgi:hypothetical protein